MTKRVCVWCAAVFLASAAHADRITQVIPLKAIDSRQLVAMFSASSQALRDDPSAYRQAFANRCAQKALTAAQRRRRNVQPQWYVNNELALVPEYGAVLGGPSPVLLAQAPQTGPGGQGPDGGGAAGGAQRRSGGAMLQLPEGMDPPVAIMQQNAILVKGEQAAIDQFQEIVTMLDKPQKMVNVECRLVDSPSSEVDQWGVNFATTNGGANVAAQGAAAGGVQLRAGLGNTNLLLGRNRTTSQGLLVTAPSVTTTNMVAADIEVGQTLPYFDTNITYDNFGHPHTIYTPDAIFIGVELWVLPRINADSVTMDIQPVFSEAAGTVTGPNGVSVPIVETIGTRVLVTVPDGESLVIGGASRDSDTLTANGGGLSGNSRTRERSNPTMIVTPRVLPPATPQAEEVWH